MSKKILHVEGMMCNNCAKHVREALEKVAGVASVEVDLAAKTASVTLSAEVADEILKNAVLEQDYDVTGIDAA